MSPVWWYLGNPEQGFRPPLELELRAGVSFPILALVTEFKTSEKAANVPKHGPISIVLWLTHLKKNSSKLLYGMIDFQ